MGCFFPLNFGISHHHPILRYKSCPPSSRSTCCSGQIWKNPKRVFSSRTPYLIHQYIPLTLLQTTPLNQTLLSASAATAPARRHQLVISRPDDAASPALPPASAFAFRSSFHTVSPRSFENMSNQVVPMLKTPVASPPLSA